MATLLVTGMSGTGKSAVLQALAARGHHVVDTDDPGWSTDARTPDGDVERLWVGAKIAAMLDEQVAGHRFISGCVRNQGSFYGRFDAVVLLSAPLPVLLERVDSRTSNSFGKVEHERTRILRDHAEIEPLLRATATVEIRTDRPLSEVADAVEAAAGL